MESQPPEGIQLLTLLTSLGIYYIGGPDFDIKYLPTLCAIAGDEICQQISFSVGSNSGYVELTSVF